MLLRSCQGVTFHVEREGGLEITAPEIMCLPGAGYTDSTATSCPSTLNDANRHNSIVMDSRGSLSVSMRFVQAFKRNGEIRKKIHSSEDGRLISESAYIPTSKDEPRREKGRYNNTPFHLQFILAPVDELPTILEGSCCFERFTSEVEREVSVSSPTTREEAEETMKKVRNNLPPECPSPDRYFQLTSAVRLVSNFDYKIGLNRISKEDVYVSNPIPLLDDVDTSTKDEGVTISFTLKSLSDKPVPHVLLVSNCAAEIDLTLNVGNDTNQSSTDLSGTGITFNIASVDMGHASRFGELPLSMMGIIPFYGSLVFCYGFLASIWFLRSKSVFMMPLQSSIKTLVYMQLVFCCLAFSYYVHLNRKSVDVEVLYSGTAAALVNWDVWSITVALGHFCTILACQFVVTLAADGTWLIQNNIRRSTRRALMILSGAWIIFFVIYGFVTPFTRRLYFALCGATWIVFVLCLIRNSLNYLKSMIMEGNSNESVIAGGGILVAKRSLFRKMFGAIAAYPIVFIASLVWRSVVRINNFYPLLLKHALYLLLIRRVLTYLLFQIDTTRQMGMDRLCSW